MQQAKRRYRKGGKGIMTPRQAVKGLRPPTASGPRPRATSSPATETPTLDAVAQDVPGNLDQETPEIWMCESGEGSSDLDMGIDVPQADMGPGGSKDFFVQLLSQLTGVGETDVMKLLAKGPEGWAKAFGSGVLDPLMSGAGVGILEFWEWAEDLGVGIPSTDEVGDAIVDAGEDIGKGIADAFGL